MAVPFSFAMRGEASALPPGFVPAICGFCGVPLHHFPPECPRRLAIQLRTAPPGWEWEYGEVVQHASLRPAGRLSATGTLVMTDYCSKLQLRAT